MSGSDRTRERIASTLTHRGAAGNIAVFAARFIQGRLEGYEKDMKICLRPMHLELSKDPTHAYLPALAACCGFIEYLSGLYRGKLQGTGPQQIAEFAAKYLPQPDYDKEAVRILFEVFRNPIAHRGIASGIWVDRNNGPGKGRRITWQVSADAKRPACEILSRTGQLTRDPPWPCSYTHRGHIHLRSMWVDIRRAATRYSADIADPQLQSHFVSCMKHLYPI
jgi:hypothetical protein